MSEKSADRAGFVPPSIEEIVSDAAYRGWVEQLSRPLVTALVREAVLRVREQPGADIELLNRTVRELLGRWQRGAQTPVINATGVLIHTNLGRAPLDRALWSQIEERVTGYGTLELDLDSGERGRRAPLVNRLLAELGGAQAGLVVNNCAAAVLLMLCLARGKKVLVSRGELVQIGGGFRIPEIMAQSGALLVEVGTTNRTVLKDYEGAIDGETAAILKVHRSNFQMMGFVEDVESRSLRPLCDKHGLRLLEDLGSGAVTDLTKYGLPHERTLADAVRDGADVVCVSGDKLLGGPQSGCMVGKADAIGLVAKHPLYRALRPGKIALATLEVTALAHLNGRAEETLPLYQLLACPVAELRRRAARVVDASGARALEVVASQAVTGGGTLPGATMESVAIVARPPSAEKAAASLRLLHPPVLTRLQDDRVYFDLKTVFPEQDEQLARAIAGIVAA